MNLLCKLGFHKEVYKVEAAIVETTTECKGLLIEHYCKRCLKTLKWVTINTPTSLPASVPNITIVKCNHPNGH